jgi:hypothetical protein
MHSSPMQVIAARLGAVLVPGVLSTECLTAYCMALYMLCFAVSYSRMPSTATLFSARCCMTLQLS